MTTSSVLTAAEVAARVRRSLNWFRRNRHRLQAEGFPAPLPGFHNRLWSTAAVDRWLAGEVPAPPVETEADAITLRIKERAKVIAGERGHKIRALP